MFILKNALKNTTVAYLGVASNIYLPKLTCAVVAMELEETRHYHCWVLERRAIYPAMAIQVRRARLPCGEVGSINI